MDGWVVIGTKLDTKQLEKDLKSSERQLRQYEKEAEKLTDKKAKLEIDLQGYYEAKKTIEDMTNEALKLAQTEGEVSQQLRLEQTELEKLDLKYSKQLDALEDVEMQMKENTKNQSLLNNEIDETNRKLQQSKGISSVSGTVNDIGKQTSKAIRGVGKWALAIFGLRSAYMFVRQSASTLAQYNDQIASDLEYISFAMASMLQPIIEKMIQLVYKLLNYVNYIAKAWFGVDLFANASAKAMEKGSKSAEKMKKSLAGFDEMNVLNDNGTTGAMGNVAPSVDLSAPENVEIPDWLKWIKENKDIVIAGLLGIAGALVSVNLGLNLIRSFGVGVAIFGLIKFIQDLSKYLDQLNGDLENCGTSMEGFGKIISDVGLIILGVGLIFLDLPAIILGVAVTICGIVYSKSDEINKIVEEKIFKPIDKLINRLETKGIFGNSLKIGLISLKSFIEMGLTYFNDFGLSIKQVFDGILLVLKGDFKNGFVNIFKGIVNLAISMINLLINSLNATWVGVRVLITEIGKATGKKWKISDVKIPTIPKLAKGTILNYPGNGVPVAGGNAIAGEAGREAYLPLSDTQLLEELGSTIGKYITINANITNTMNGRIISRELQKINANSDFATNS